MKKFLEKLTSRKFIACIAGIIIGVCMSFGIDEGAITKIAGAVTSLSSVIVYIVAEGKIDAEAVDKIKDAADAIGEASDEVEKIED